MNNLKLAAIGALATAGLATTAIAQPKVEHRPSAKENSQGQERGAMQGNMPGMKGDMSGMMAMMNDPEMRAQMMDMMRNCKEMMKKKQDQMSGAEAG